MEEQRLRAFENRVLRRKFGPKRDEAARGRRRPHTEEGDQVREDEMVMASVCMRDMGNAHMILVGKPEGKRPLRRHRHRCKDNIRMDPREIG
jgi:hypothetical protein